MTAPLSKSQIAFLRGKAHPLGPLLSLGKQGMTPGFLENLNRELTKHELVKLRVGKHVEIDPKALAVASNSALVQNVGRMIVLYRAADEPVLNLPAS